jgi:aminoglycoside phosphotransferase (APT) family kinase protein
MNDQMQKLSERFTAFADRLGDRLSDARRDLYRRFLDATPRLLERYHSHRNHTIIHGDAHVWNCFLPRDGGADVRFFDWDAWRINAATNDLAYMMATHWYPERRRRMERALLDHYHAALVAHGVRGYDRDALDDDYRLSVLWQLAIPLWQSSIDLPPVIWWGHLERVVLAIEDLGCAELLG